jgi:putative peptidoglycan lipid II flippase
VSVFSSARTISLWTLASRVLGLVRDMLSARLLGRSVYNSAFILAFLVPNLFRRLFGEGALSSAFIPVYVEYLEGGKKDEAQSLAAKAATLLVTLLAALAAMGVGASLVAVSYFTLGEKWDLTLRLLAILLPYVVLICLVALYMAILNSHRHFTTSALAPVLLNVFWIGGLLAGWYFFRDDRTSIVYLLAGTVILAGAAQVLMHIPPLRRRGVRLRPDFDFRHEGLGRVKRNLAPMVLGLALVQVNTLLDQVIAVGCVPDAGAVATLFYANRMVQFPLALIGIAIGTALLPTLSSDAAGGRKKEFEAHLLDALRLAAFLGIGATVGLMVLARPVIGAFFQGAHFTAADTTRTAGTLVFYALAVLPYCVLVVLARAFYAYQDTKTPVRISIIAMIINLCLNLTLVWFLEEAGLAVATAASSTINVLLLYAALNRRYKFTIGKKILATVLRGAVVSLVMAAGCFGLLYILPGDAASASALVRVTHLSVPLIAGLALFILTSRLLAKEEFHMLGRAVFKK